ncbi:MAG: HlyD family efflux transporter periplasmic adaptor subunit [Clostridia bacterium]|nr:HlyD family efflux transporter periplasmic adaptor subunit [Clostridia bacterium]
MVRRRRHKRSKLLSIVLGVVVLYFLLKITFSYLPVEVVQAKVSELEDALEGEFIVLRQERVITASCKGYFIKVKNEGERVAKDTVLGYLEKVAGTSLEKKSSLPIKASAAGLISYEIDGMESICTPEMWRQLDLGKLEAFLQTVETSLTQKDDEANLKREGGVEAGEGICKIVNNLDCCYFYWVGVGAYPEKIKKGGKIRIRLEGNQGLVLNGLVTDLSRQTGKYGILIEILNLGNLNPRRQEKGEIVVQSYKGVVLPEKVLVEKDGQDGVYLFQKGRACWQEVEKTAHLRGKVVLSNLTEKDWVITDPQLVTEGKRVTRINK